MLLCTHVRIYNGHALAGNENFWCVLLSTNPLQLRKKSTPKTVRDIQTSRSDCQPAGHFTTQATPQLKILPANSLGFEEKCSEQFEPSTVNQTYRWWDKKKAQYQYAIRKFLFRRVLGTVEKAACIGPLVVGDIWVLRSRDRNPDHPLQKSCGWCFWWLGFSPSLPAPRSPGHPQHPSQGGSLQPFTIKTKGVVDDGRKGKFLTQNKKKKPYPSLPTTIYSRDGTWRTGPAR